MWNFQFIYISVKNCFSSWNCSLFTLFISCVLCPMSYVLCYMSCVICPVSYVLCPVSCVLCPMSYVLCPLSYVLCPMSHVLCPVSYVLYVLYVLYLTNIYYYKHLGPFDSILTPFKYIWEINNISVRRSISLYIMLLLHNNISLYPKISWNTPTQKIPNVLQNGKTKWSIDTQF